MRADREQRWTARATLAITVVMAVIAYFGIALPAHWWPFGGEDRTPDVRVDVAQSHLNALGRDAASAEYVCLVNSSGEALDMTGWELRDSLGLVNELPAFELAAHGQVRVHPGRGTDSRTDLHGHAGRPAWNNGGDTITLLDDHGETVARVSYPAQDVEGMEYSSCGPGPRP